MSEPPVYKSTEKDAAAQAAFYKVIVPILNVSDNNLSA